MVETAPARISQPRPAEPRIRLLTVDEYHRMAEAGILESDERVELLEGQLVTMAAMGSYHVACVSILAEWFMTRLTGRATVIIQSPVRLGPHNEPEPDLALLRPRRDAYGAGLPGPDDTFLVVEVSDRTFRQDRDVKLPLYAAAGIPEAWIFDVNGSRVLACSQPHDDGYEQIRTVRGDEILSPAAFSDLKLRPGEIFRLIRSGER